MADKPQIEIKRGTKGAAGAVAQAQPARKPRSTDKTVRRGVGIKSSTWDEVRRIGDAEGLTDNAVMRLAIEYFAQEYDAGPARAYVKKRTVTSKKII